MGRRILRHRMEKNKIILNRLLAEIGTLKLPQMRAEKKMRNMELAVRGKVIFVM